jgi:hypothetical protein
MKPNKLSLCVAFLIISCPALVVAKEQKAPERPVIFQQLIDCRAIADSAARLACYDKQVAAIDAAEASDSVVVVDREQVKKANRGLFGLGGIQIGSLFGKADHKEEEIDRIEAPIKSASQSATGRWTLVLDDGARWAQIDEKSISDPKAGQMVKIRKASMGTYFANVNNQTAIRVKRQN